uniref:Uncharacterized protein n=1 Tax=Rhizophora mucronata TaxID=61149 RepID=A0A2P2NGP7_RHIMU
MFSNRSCYDTDKKISLNTFIPQSKHVYNKTHVEEIVHHENLIPR